MSDDFDVITGPATPIPPAPKGAARQVRHVGS